MWFTIKFIFPQNYQFKNKILGIIDYQTAFVNIIWYIIVFIIANIIFKSLNSKIIFFISFSLPLLLFSFSGFNGENILLVIKYLLKFIFKQKIYFYGHISKN